MKGIPPPGFLRTMGHGLEVVSVCVVCALSCKMLSYTKKKQHMALAIPFPLFPLKSVLTSN